MRINGDNTNYTLHVSTGASSGNVTLSNAVGYARRIRDANCVENAQILYNCIEEVMSQTIVVTVNCGMYNIKVTYSLNSIQFIFS